MLLPASSTVVVSCVFMRWCSGTNIPAFFSQDSAIKRPDDETIVADGDIVTGVNTKFTELFEDRDKIRFRGKSEQFKVGLFMYFRSSPHAASHLA